MDVPLIFTSLFAGFVMGSNGKRSWPPDMAHSPRDIRVVVLLNAEEYTAMGAAADDDGLSDSAFIRCLLLARIRERALTKLSLRQSDGDRQEPAQVIDNGLRVIA